MIGFELTELLSDNPRLDNKPESEIDEIRLWLFVRGAPVKGVKDARLLDSGVAKAVNPVLDVSTDMLLTWLIRRFSVCSLIKPRLRKL